MTDNNYYRMFKWIIPNYRNSYNKEINSKIFTISKNINITFLITEDQKTSYVTFHLDVKTNQIKINDAFKLSTSLSFLNASNQKVFTSQFREYSYDEYTNTFDIGKFTKYFLRKCLVEKDLVLFYEIELFFGSNIVDLQLTEEHETFIVDKDFQDVTLLLGDKTINSHKSILASRSPVFRAMFTTQMKESINNEVKITDFDYDVFIEVLRFMYTGKIENLDQLALQILKAAHFYQITDLMITCERVLPKSLNFENGLEILKLADDCGAKILLNSCVMYIIQHLKSFQMSSDLEDLTKTHPHLLLKIIKSCNP